MAGFDGLSFAWVGTEERGKGLAGRSREVGARWLDDLRGLAEAHACVGDVRGRGLAIGIDLVRDRATREPHPELARRVVVAALEEGWLVLAGGQDGNVLTLTPPLVIEEDLLEGATAMLDRVLAGAGF